MKYEGRLFNIRRLSFSSGVVDYLAKSGIPIHFFNYYGFYEGSFYPRETLISGDLTVKQASNYLDSTKRLILAKSFVEGACGNILRNLNYYAREMKSLETHIEGSNPRSQDSRGPRLSRRL